MKRKYLNATHRHCAGQSLIELTFALPIFLLVLFGMFEVGRILFTIHGLNVSARSGARAGVVQIRNENAINLAVATTRDLLATFNLNDAGTSVTAQVIQVQGRDAVKVTVNRTFNFIFTQGYLINVGTFQAFPTSIALTSVATMRKEG